jgi:hypothetical protein
MPFERALWQQVLEEGWQLAWLVTAKIVMAGLKGLREHRTKGP